MNTIPKVDPAQTDEQGRPIARPQPGAGDGTVPLQPVKSPLNLDNARDIVSSSGLGGAQENLSNSQFPKMPELPGEGAPAEGAGAAEGAAGAGALEELLPLAAL